MIAMELALQGSLVHPVEAEICRLAVFIVLYQNTKTGCRKDPWSWWDKH